MEIYTTRFGPLDISEESILHMPDGMIGLPSSKQYALIEDRPGTPFKWLQSVTDPALAFIVINPMDFFPDYSIELNDDAAAGLGLEEPGDATTLTTVTIDPREGLATTNLLGPVIVNHRTLLAKQIVLQSEEYGTKHLIGRRNSTPVTSANVVAV